MQAVGLDLAPAPLWLDESCSVVPYPAVAYRWLAGDAARSEPDGAAACRANRKHPAPSRPRAGRRRRRWAARRLVSLVRLRAISRRTEDPSFPSTGPGWSAPTAQGRQLRRRLTRLVEECSILVAGSQANASRDGVPFAAVPRRSGPGERPVVLTTAGFAGSTGEYSGWGDPALDLADLRWHAALDGLSSAEHGRLRDSYRRPIGDTGFEERLAVWDRLIATRWAFLDPALAVERPRRAGSGAADPAGERRHRR